MNQREVWQGHMKGIEDSWQRAKAISEEAGALFSEYINLEEEKAVLDQQWGNWQKERFEIVVVGEFSTGKSTFINALLHKEVLPSKVTPTTATINYIRHMEQGDHQEKAVIHFYNGDKIEITFDELVDYVTEMSEKLRVVDEVSYVDLFVDSPYLKDGVVIVDTPGLQALHPEHERITKEQIKRSNASVLLFNMEQPGKRSEFHFLKDLSDSIERIFFVGNRMDGVPDDELDEVIDSLETALRENQFQPISMDQAKLFPVSSLQALKGKDPGVETKHWNDWTSQQLLESSRFMEFEQRLEDYLFNGEKAKDVIRSPFQALYHYYEQIREKIAQIEVMISGEISVEQLEAEKIRLTEEVELRKLQLQEQQRNLKHLFQDVIHQQEASFNERRENLLQYFVDQIRSVQLIDDLEEEVSSLVIDVNREIPQLVDRSLQELSVQMQFTMRREIDNFEVELCEGTGDSLQDFGIAEVSVTTAVKRKGFAEVTQEVEERYASESAQLEEEKQLVKKKRHYQNELALAKERQRIHREHQQNEARFQDLLLNNTDSTKKEYGVIKKRTLWFDKKGMRDVPNEEYDQRVKEKKELMKKQHADQFGMQKELDTISSRIINSESEFHDIEEYYEAKRELKSRKDEERVMKIQEMTNVEVRQLGREQKKVIREFEAVFDNLRRDYRSLLRGLDALKLAEQSIESYIEGKDVELNQKLQELGRKEKLLFENSEKQEKYKDHTKTILDKVESEYESITSLYLNLI
jgi:GTPase SAR1 family protein